MLTTNCKSAAVTETPTKLQKSESPLMQSCMTTASQEIEIHLCDHDNFEFELTEKSCEADGTKIRSVELSEKSCEVDRS